jgi:multiple antibiotic resistance protein
MWWQRNLSEFVTLLLVINPFVALPVFLSIGGAQEQSAQRKLAASATVISFLVLVFFVFAGAFLLQQMGISIRAFQVSGGILLFLVALEMLRGAGHSAGPVERPAGSSLAVYPLAIPTIAGPGSMLTVVLLTDDDRHDVPEQMVTVGILALVLLITFLILLASGPISRMIGTAGVSIIGRIMAMLLAALAVTMVVSAVGDWLSLPRL